MQWPLCLVLVCISAVSTYSQAPSLSSESSIYLPLAKECAPGCERNGNCNVEEGRCECPWGYTGPACETDYMKHCKFGLEDPGSCGLYFPKNCECYKACRKLYCRKGLDHPECDHEIGQFMPGAITCYVYNNKPHHQQVSVLPLDTDTSVTWYRGFEDMYGKPDSQFIIPRDQQFKCGGINGDSWALQAHHCPSSCSGHGVCKRWNNPGASPECLCRKGWNGTDCGTPDPHEACWFSPDCGGRGVCRNGFCHCQPGYFGWGCHRSKAWQPKHADHPPVPNRSRLRVYMYELPWTVSFPYEFGDGGFGRDNIYTTYEHFMKWFLQDNEVRTENPHEATLFYIPMLLYFYVGNVRNPVGHVETVFNHVRTNFPFWNRTGGRDHFFFMVGDRSTCEVPRWLQQTAIKVVHFGMQRRNLHNAWRDHNLNNEYGCIQFTRDVVVAPLNAKALEPRTAEKYYQDLGAAKGHDPKRTLLFFFAGGVHLTELRYSGGARQAIYLLLKHNNATDVLFIEGQTKEYQRLMFESKFCIAPYGYGWGVRLVQAMQMGCIPVIIQDHVHQPYEELLPYDEFSVRLPLAAVPRLLEVLRGFGDEDLARLRLGMAKYYKAFIWEKSCNGSAYHYTLRSLHRRAQNYWGQHLESEDNQWTTVIALSAAATAVAAAEAGAASGRRSSNLRRSLAGLMQTVGENAHAAEVELGMGAMMANPWRQAVAVSGGQQFVMHDEHGGQEPSGNEGQDEPDNDAQQQQDDDDEAAAGSRQASAQQQALASPSLQRGQDEVEANTLTGSAGGSAGHGSSADGVEDTQPVRFITDADNDYYHYFDEYFEDGDG